MPAKPNKVVRYRVVRHSSVRLYPGDPERLDEKEWLPGDIVDGYPAHTDVDGFLEVGAWEAVDDG